MIAAWLRARRNDQIHAHAITSYLVAQALSKRQADAPDGESSFALRIPDRDMRGGGRVSR